MTIIGKCISRTDEHISFFSSVGKNEQVQVKHIMTATEKCITRIHEHIVCISGNDNNRQVYIKHFRSQCTCIYMYILGNDNNMYVYFRLWQPSTSVYHASTNLTI